MKTVLVADDEYAIVAAIRELLEDEGYAVLTACDGEAALELIERARPDVVLLDVMMPRIDGRAVLRAIRDRPGLASTPVIVMSAARLSQGAEEFEGRLFLQKPFALTRLLALIKAAISPPASPPE